MCSGELQRLSELRDHSIRLQSSQAYFQFDDTKFADPQKRKFFLSIERELQGLDIQAWNFLRKEALPRLTARDSSRGWQQLFDTLNEAKGYNYLMRIGCTNIKFIPRSVVNKVRTPDLHGLLAPTEVLCEVKTINVSEFEAKRRKSSGVGTILAHLEQAFFGKLASDINVATSQMFSYNSDAGIFRIVFVVVNFDDGLHEYANEYQSQIEAYIANLPTPGIQVILDIKPPFYSAM